eukprot:TRINITY_DN57272_c0_g1_i1.p1 TRINITY_DN57272_c0_g1~~TRINITY_DN57272_c0_g1_i1.p1  ORF type:complete len:1057 (-),score=311.24 TRINITY_DN57272_c0_g1_i1:88-3213(-)
MPNNKKKVGKGRLDKYYHLAKDQGYRARSAFKLIQLAKKVDFLSKSRVCLDLCAAPGGWSQVAQKNMPAGSQIIAIDLAPIKPLPGVTCMQSDITTEKCRSLLRRELKGSRADVVLHDGAPNVGSSWSRDAFSQAELTLHSLKLACDFLRAGGVFVTKVFRSADYNSLLWVFNQLFNKVDATKPTASRNVSAEIFVICIGFKAGKIDPRFFDSKWVFMEALDPIKQDDEDAKKPGASLTEHFKNLKKKHRSGYEEGDDNRIVPAHDFIASDNPAEILIKAHKLNLEAPGSEPLAANELTTSDIRDLCADLKVLGKADLSQLLKWRMKILREQDKKERAAAKKSSEENSALAVKAKAAKVDAAKAAAKKAVDRGLAPDLDDAIAQFLGGAEDTNEAGEGPLGTEANDASGKEDEAEDDRLEEELQTQINKRRREERREAKRLSERQKKQEWRKKMSLISNKSGGPDHAELFKVTDKAVEALEDDSAYPKELVSDEEDSEKEGEQPEESDSDDELDRVARMEVDLAVSHELRLAELNDKNRTVVQRRAKRKKETRRQQVMKAWAGELGAFDQSLQQQAASDQALRDKEESGDDDDSADEDELQALRKFQASLESGTAGEGRDVEALRALADGPGDEREALSEAENDPGSDGERQRRRRAVDAEDDEEEDEDEARPRYALEASKETALVPIDEDALRGEQRSKRWFSQDIFKGVQLGTSTGSKSRAVRAVDRASEDENSDSDRGQMRELSDAQLPKLPLTDKEKRKMKRKKDTERLEKLGIKPKGKQQEEEEKGPLEVAPLEAPKSIVPSRGKFQKPSDPRELAETLALGSLLVESKKSRMELLDAAYNRWTFEPNEALPQWFTEEEEKFNKPELPISKELMDQFRAKLREINARPIRKVAEARARKKRRLGKKLEKLRSTAMSLAQTDDMSESAKARQMRKAVSKMARQDQRKVTTVAIKKGGGGNKVDKSKAPKGAKVKIVDKRMKSDRRGEKKANKRNPARQKIRAKKQQKKLAMGKRRGMGDKGNKTGKKRGRAKGGGGD